MKTIAVIAAALVLPLQAAPAISQDMAATIATEVYSSFAADGMLVELQGGIAVDDTISYAGAAVGVPGHIKTDGWLVWPTIAGLGRIVLEGVDGRSADLIRLPTISGPVRGMNVAAHDVNIRDVVFGETALRSSLSAISAAPVTVSGTHAMFASADRISIAAGGERCVEVEVEGLAVDMRVAAPMIQSAFPQGILKGTATASLDCRGDTLVLRTIGLSFPETAAVEIETEITFDPRSLASLFIAEREQMNELFFADAPVEDIEAADKASFAVLGDNMSVGATTLRVSDQGLADRLSAAMPGGSASVAAAGRLFLGGLLFPEVAESVLEPAVQMLSEGGELTVNFSPDAVRTLSTVLSPGLDAGFYTAGSGSAGN